MYLERRGKQFEEVSETGTLSAIMSGQPGIWGLQERHSFFWALEPAGEKKENHNVKGGIKMSAAKLK